MKSKRSETGSAGRPSAPGKWRLCPSTASHASGRKGCDSIGYLLERSAVPLRELHEQAAGFLDANRVFNPTELTAALGQPRDSEAVRSLLRQFAMVGRIKRAAREVFIVTGNASPSRFAVEDCIIASKLRPDGVLGYHTALELYGISHTVLYNRVHLISYGRPEAMKLPFQSCHIVRPYRTLI